MSDWVRNENIEDSFQELHGIRPKVYKFLPYVKNTNKTKVVFGSAYVITEILERGLTKNVVLEYEDKTEQFERVYDAERRIVELGTR